MPDHTRVTAHVNLQAIEHNLKWLHTHLHCKQTTKRPFVWSVVKADAYGHGLATIFPALRHADGLAVLTLNDAWLCRQRGWRGPIMVMRTDFEIDDLRHEELLPLHLVIDNPDQLHQLAASAHPLNLHIWLRHAGELHHTGFHTPDFIAADKQLQALLDQGRIQSLRPFLHPAQAEMAVDFQREYWQFEQQFQRSATQGCLFNSAALLTCPDLARKACWVRSGILLYGISPIAGLTGTDLGLQPAMTLKAPVYGVQTLKKGDRIGYGSRYQAQSDMRVGLVRCGYSDGYPRQPGTNATVLINERPAPIIGTVAMDLLTIDLTQHPNAGAGTSVTLWGPGLPLEHVADKAGTIAAALCSGLTAQVMRQADHTETLA